MRLEYIELQNLLSFGADPQRISFDPSLTVLVGPNGAGKTNVYRAIELVRNLVDPSGWGNPGLPFASRRNQLLGVPPHQDHLTKESAIRLGVKFDSQERTEIELFVAGCIADSLKTTTTEVDRKPEEVVSRARELARLLNLQLGDCKLKCRHNRQAQSEWIVEFDFTVNGVSYSYALSSPGRLFPVSPGDLYLENTEAFSGNSISQSLSERFVSGHAKLHRYGQVIAR